MSGYSIAIGGCTLYSSSCGGCWGVEKCSTSEGIIDWTNTGCNDGTLVYQNGDYSSGKLFLCVKSF